MIKYISEKQLSISEFKTPFLTDLNPDNRWVKLSQVVPWEDFATLYISMMNTKHGRLGVSPRTMLGAIIIKHKENLRNQKAIEAIQGNIYMQFFVGLNSFQTK